MIRTQVSLDPDLYERARALARQQGISFAELCRRSLAIALARVPGNKPWMAYIGVVEGRPDDSCTVAALSRRDRHHPRARMLFSGVRPHWHTSLPVWSEAYSWFLHRHGEDASSLVFIEQLGIDTVWSTDHHLGLTGAEVLPRG